MSNVRPLKGTSMRAIICLLAAAVCISCATSDYQPYEGKSNLYEGKGGTKVVVDGVDFWANGEPPRKYTILGVVANEVGSGIGDEAIIRAAAANEVKKRGGHAAIQLDSNSSISGIVRTSPGFYMAAGVKRMQFAVIRYVE